MRYYGIFEEFVEDMQTLFLNWVKFRGKGKIYTPSNDMTLNLTLEHKMYKYCEAVEKRFEKFVEKAREKVSTYE
jgi:hypothetical protein